MRRAAKRDESEKAIVTVLKAAGWSILRVNEPDGPDLVVSRRGRVACIECKTGKEKLRPGQQQFAETWQGEYVVLRTVDDALIFHFGGQVPA